MSTTTGYFPGEHLQLRASLEAHFRRLREAMEAPGAPRGKVSALVLGGGYGRGEGGVLANEGGGESLFNDLDYFLFAETPEAPAVRRWVREVEAAESRALGIDVEIKCLARREVERGVAGSMMFLDLALGHEVVWGEAGWLAELGGRLDPAHLPLAEATRLLWNRGSGLYFALCRIGARREPEFVWRNHQKCALALGDASLCAEGRYHPSSVERLRRLRAGEAGDVSDELLERYGIAAEFKLHPRPCARTWEELRADNAALRAMWEGVFLRVESRRTGREFESLEAYAAGRRRLFGGEVPLWRAPLFALRDALRYRACLKPVWDYPRAALMRALCCLLDLGNHPTALGRVGEFLPAGAPVAGVRGTPALQQWERSYEDWWRRYS